MEFMEGEGAAVGTAAAFRGLGWRRHRGRLFYFLALFAKDFHK
jgi:hypothetical protein